MTRGLTRSATVRQLLTARHFTPQRLLPNNRYNFTQAVHSYLYGLLCVNGARPRGYFSQPVEQFKLDFDRGGRRTLFCLRVYAVQQQKLLLSNE